MSSFRNISGMGIEVNAGASSSALPLDLSGFQTTITSATNIALNTLTAAALKFVGYFTVQAYDAWGTLFPLISYFYDGSGWETLEIRPAPAGQTAASIQLKKNGHQVAIYGSTTGINTGTVTLGNGSSANTRVYGDLILDKGWSSGRINGQRTGDGVQFPIVELSFVNGTVRDQVSLKDPNGYGIQVNATGASLIGPNGQSASINGTGFSTSGNLTVGGVISGGIAFSLIKYVLIGDMTTGSYLAQPNLETVVPFPVVQIFQGTNPVTQTSVTIGGKAWDYGYKNTSGKTILLLVSYQITMNTIGMANGVGYRTACLLAPLARRLAQTSVQACPDIPTILSSSAVILLNPDEGFVPLTMQGGTNAAGYLDSFNGTVRNTYLQITQLM